MESWKIAKEYLVKKCVLLEKIAGKTETQCRFIHKREMTGLKRIQRERDALLEEILEINENLTKDESWKNISELRPLVEEIYQREQAILQRSQQVRQEAVNERIRIAAELRNRKMQRQVKNQYINPWATMLQGSRINERG